MKKIPWLVLPIFGMLLWLILGSNEDQEKYKKQIESIIQDRINYLKNGSQSPFILHSIPFRAPQYYPIDTKYRVNASLDRIARKKRIDLPTSDGLTDTYEHFAWANFKLDDQAMKLLILRKKGRGPLKQYFLAFSDGTSAKETYGGGRYIEVEIGKSDKIIIDFNLAYNPYCAYAAQYSCPLPPAENILPVSIHAGEKDFKSY
ncbi:MAG: DUF1684 domain-containing protein [Cyclobacteriaceae bacterium]|nr:DUF1684 domain-containing protein [Cyclobacteriaceae bacterium HetDA_MAG_MS6]